MKFFKSSKLVHFCAVLVLCSMVTACGLISVSWIRSASRNDIVNLGDSIFALSGKEHDYLQSWYGQTFRRYAKSGAMITGGDSITPDLNMQLNAAIGDSPNIKIIFMDGGGNDILIPATLFDPYNCKVDWWESGLSNSCKSLINDVAVDCSDLLARLTQAGVKAVIYQGYYHVKNGLIGTTALNKAVDYGDDKLSLAVTYSSLPWKVYLDPRKLTNITNSDIIIDGIHPTDSGSYKLAWLIKLQLDTLINQTL
jgi:hypothetical protein